MGLGEEGFQEEWADHTRSLSQIRARHMRNKEKPRGNEETGVKTELMLTLAQGQKERGAMGKG